MDVKLDAEGKGWRLYTEVQYSFQIPFSLAEYTVVFDRTDDMYDRPIALFTIGETFQEASSRPTVDIVNDNEIAYRSECGVAFVRIPEDSLHRLPILEIRPRSENDAQYYDLGGEALSDGPDAIEPERP